MTQFRKGDLVDRIERLSEPELNTGCRLWAGNLNAYGYGRIKINRKPTTAHRASYAAAHGDITSAEQVLHRCDTPACVNPDHLFLGSHADNMADMKAKGRHVGTSKLNREQVADIVARRTAGEAGKDLAKEFGISAATVSEIFHGKRYSVRPDARFADAGQYVRTPVSA